jgi:predicted nucleic acid-binding protein
MNKIFLDTNILLDYYLNRPGADAAEKVFEKAYTGKITLYASTLTFATFAYVVKKNNTREEVYYALDEVEKRIMALTMDRKQLRQAINHPCRDFEDMLQYQCAKAAKCDAIITNNKRDFLEFSKLPCLTAEEFLLQLNSEE